MGRVVCILFPQALCPDPSMTPSALQPHPGAGQVHGLEAGKRPHQVSRQMHWAAALPPCAETLGRPSPCTSIPPLRTQGTWQTWAPLWCDRGMRAGGGQWGPGLPGQRKDQKRGPRMQRAVQGMTTCERKGQATGARPNASSDSAIKATSTWRAFKF